MRRRILRPKNPDALSKRLDELEAKLGLTSQQKSAIADLRKLTKPMILTNSPVQFGNSGTLSRGESLTLSTSVYRSGGSASSLSQILETGTIPQRYFLTGTACRGILRRAEKRGRELPQALLAALTAAAKVDMP